MAKTEAERRANKKYAQTPKGKEVLKKAHERRAHTDEYRAYQREKQKEYRQRKKLEALEPAQVQSQPVAEVTPATKSLWVKVPLEVNEILRSLPSRSDYIRDAVVKQLREDGLLLFDQDSTAVEAIKPHAQEN